MIRDRWGVIARKRESQVNGMNKNKSKMSYKMSCQIENLLKWIE